VFREMIAEKSIVLDEDVPGDGLAATVVEPIVAMGDVAKAEPPELAEAIDIEGTRPEGETLRWDAD